jgi:hypothetical protein
MNLNWYLIPLAASISLVYSSSRYELTDRILRRSLRLFITILTAMSLVFVVLWALSAGT